MRLPQNKAPVDCKHPCDGKLQRSSRVLGQHRPALLSVEELAHRPLTSEETTVPGRWVSWIPHPNGTDRECPNSILTHSLPKSGVRVQDLVSQHARLAGWVSCIHKGGRKEQPCQR